MNSTEVHASDYTDAEKQHTTTDSTKRNTESSGRQHVNVLLDLSEKDCCREHSIHLLQNRNGWEDAVSHVCYQKHIGKRNIHILTMLSPQLTDISIDIAVSIMFISRCPSLYHYFVVNCS